MDGFALRYILLLLLLHPRINIISEDVVEDLLSVAEDVLGVDHSPGQSVAVLVVLPPVLCYLGCLFPRYRVLVQDAPHTRPRSLHRQESEGSLAEPGAHLPPGLAAVGESGVSPLVDVNDHTPGVAGHSPGYEPELV